MTRVLRVRNKRSHSQDLTAREYYYEIESLIEFFEMVKSLEQNLVSQNKTQFLKQLEETRIRALMQLSKEEQAHQVIRTANTPNLMNFEFKGLPEID